jgi:hypothetical protein
MAVQLNQDIKPVGVSSGVVRAPFDEAKEALEKAGYQIITARESASLRVDYGTRHSVSTNGNYVKEGVLYVPQKGRFITRGSLVLASPKDATKAHRSGNEFYVDSAQVDLVLGDSVNVPYDAQPIPTNRFGEDPIAKFVFGDMAEKYGAFLKEAKIDAMPLYFNDEGYVNSKDKPYANQLWLRRLGDQSELGGNYRNLDCSFAVRGVLVGEARSAEAAPKKEEVYSATQISKVLKSARLEGLESLIITGLRANN